MSYHRPSASSLIGHSFFKQVSFALFWANSWCIRTNLHRMWSHTYSPQCFTVVNVTFQIKRRPSEALPELLRPVSPISSLDCVHPQDSPTGLASLESDLSQLDVDDWDFWHETDERWRDDGLNGKGWVTIGLLMRNWEMWKILFCVFLLFSFMGEKGKACAIWMWYRHYKEFQRSYKRLWNVS